MQKRSEEYIHRVVELYNSGVSAKEIAKREGKTIRTIQTILKDAGVSRKSRKGEVRVDVNYLESIRSLYEEGKSFEEIGRILGKSGKTIRSHIKKLGLEVHSNKSITEEQQEEFVKLFNLGYSDEQLSNHFKCSVSTVKRYRGILNLKMLRNFSQTEQNLTEIQEQMILGSLLGDLSLSRPTDKFPNSRLCIVHSVKQEELFIKKVEILGKFMGSYRITSAPPDKRTGNVYTTIRGNSLTHPIFTNLYSMVYINGIKTISKEYLSRMYHPIALAYWFMDDGTNRGTISTCSFSYNECLLIQEWLKTSFCVETTIQTHETENWNYMYITQNSREHFEELINPYIIPSMRYKMKYFK